MAQQAPPGTGNPGDDQSSGPFPPASSMGQYTSYSERRVDLRQRIKIEVSFEKGLDQSQSPSALPPGFTAVAENMIPEASGVLRVRPGIRQATALFDNASRTNAEPRTAQWPTIRQVRALLWVPTRDGAGTYRNWYMVGLTNLDGATAIGPGALDPTLQAQIWALGDDFLGKWQFLKTYSSAVSYETVPPCFAKAGANVFWCHPDANDIQSWTGNVADPITNATHNDPGRCIVFHDAYLFMGGGRTHPARVYRSAFNNGASWNTAGGGDWVDVEASDFQPIEDLCTFQTDLIIAKSTGVWIWSNANAANPSTESTITKLDGAYGSPGRCLIPTPYGLVILGDAEMFLWRGGIPKLISPAVNEDYSAGQGAARDGEYAGGYLYVSQSKPGTKNLAFDMVNGLWHTMTHFPGNEACAYTHKNNRLVGGVKASSDLLVGPLWYFDAPFDARKIDAGQGKQVFNWSTSELTPGNAQRLFTLRQYAVQWRQRGLGVGNLILRCFVDGTQMGADAVVSPRSSEGTWSRTFPGWPTGRTVQIRGYATGPDVLYDIEGIELEVEVLSPR